jgi:hypothetical protein
VYADMSYIDKSLPLYLFYVGEGEVLFEDEVLKLCNMIYENSQAVKYTFRTPGRKSTITKLRVFEVCVE